MDRLAICLGAPPNHTGGHLTARPAKGPPDRRKVNRKFVDSALGSREILRELVSRRKRQRLSQTQVATRMGTSQSAIARIEAAGMDIRMSTLERYAAAIGHQVNFKLTRLPAGKVRKSDGSQKSGPADE